MHEFWIDISKVVDRDSGVVRNHPEAAAPKGPPHQIVVVTNRPLGESIDAPGDALPVALLGVIALLRVGVTEFECLGRGEVAALGGGETTKLVI